MEYYIIIIIIGLGYYFFQEKQNEKEETARKWDAIRVQMSKYEVSKELGKPHQVWVVGTAETWRYGPNDSNGVIRFVEDKVVGFQKPEKLIDKMKM